MNQFYFEIRNNLIHTVEFGEGKKILICFHGFGEHAEKFIVLAPALSKNYSVIAVDLPFHGKTKWSSDEIFMREDLRILIDQILQLKNERRFSLLGYSMGGKIVLAAVNDFASQIDEVILAAPDGVENDRWYDVAVYPPWGQRLFFRFITKPNFVFNVAKILRAMRVLNDRLFNFLWLQTDSEEKRRMVYNVWMAMREMKTNLSQTKGILRKHQIKSFIFIGKYDQVITLAIGKNFSRGLSDCKYVILDKGHNLITESFNENLNEALQ